MLQLGGLLLEVLQTSNTSKLYNNKNNNDNNESYI